MNMIMSFQYGLSKGLVGCWAGCLGWIVVWAAFDDVKCVKRGSRTLDESTWQPWLMSRYSDLHGGYKTFEAVQMDDAARRLNGFPLLGLIQNVPGIM